MIASIREAHAALDARRQALIDPDDHPVAAVAFDEQRARLLMSGLDIDFDEIASYGQYVAERLLELSIANPQMSAVDVLKGTFIDGILTGILRERLHGG